MPVSGKVSQHSTGKLQALQKKHREQAFGGRKPVAGGIETHHRKYKKRPRKIRIQALAETALGRDGKKFEGTYDMSGADKGDPRPDVPELLQLWTDGSYEPRSKSGISGAGVVHLGELSTLDNLYWIEHSVWIGKNVGDNNDAEIYAIARALILAAMIAERNSETLKRIVIYTDTQCIKQLHTRKYSVLGPMLNEPWAIELILELADKLSGRGISLKICWVKGHNRCTGNERADQAATKAVEGLARHLSLHDHSDADKLPRHWEGKDSNTLDEFRHRKSGKRDAKYRLALALRLLP